MGRIKKMFSHKCMFNKSYSYIVLTSAFLTGLRIHVSREAYLRLVELGGFYLEERGQVKIKVKQQNHLQNDSQCKTLKIISRRTAHIHLALETISASTTIENFANKRSFSFHTTCLSFEYHSFSCA